MHLLESLSDRRLLKQTVRWLHCTYRGACLWQYAGPPWSTKTREYLTKILRITDLKNMYAYISQIILYLKIGVFQQSWKLLLVVAIESFKHVKKTLLKWVVCLISIYIELKVYITVERCSMMSASPINQVGNRKQLEFDGFRPRTRSSLIAISQSLPLKKIKKS